MSSLWRSIFVVFAQIEQGVVIIVLVVLGGVIIVQACRRTLQALEGVIIVLAGKKEVDYARSSLHSTMNLPSHKFSFNPTNCEPVVKEFTPKQSISHDVLFFLLLNSKKDSSGVACANSNLGSQREFCYLHPFII